MILQSMFGNKSNNLDKKNRSIGCILAELLNQGIPILQGKNEIHQFTLICELIG